MRNMLVESQETSDRCSAAHKDTHCSQSPINKPLEERRFPAKASTPIFLSEPRYWENRPTGLPKSSRLSELGAFVLLRRCVKGQWSESWPTGLYNHKTSVTSKITGLKLKIWNIKQTQTTRFSSQEKKKKV